MNFYDTITEKGYELLKLEDVFDISKTEGKVETHIVFYSKEKKLVGYVKALDNLYDIDDMAYIYKRYLELQKDLKFFAEKSKYDII